MEEKYRHFLFGIVASVGLCFIILVFFTGDEALKDNPAFLYFFLFLLFIILFLLIVYFALEIIFVSPSTSTKWHIVTECSQDQELHSKRKLLFHPEVTVFPNSVISYCEAVEQVEFASSDCYFMPGSFEGCANLEYIKLPHRLERIPDNMFRNCSSLKEIIIPPTVKSIGKNAFDGCIGLTSVEIPAGVVDPGLFPAVTGECRVVVTGEITGSTVEKLRSMIDGMSAGAKIRLDLSQTTGLTSIGSEVFRGCSRLTSMEIPSSVASIGERAFSGCSGLTSVIFGEGAQLESIGSHVFDGCSGLTSVEIPSSVTSIGWNVFRFCGGLTSVTFGADSRLESIDNYAFMGCNGLTSVEIPESVTSIGSEAFKGCSGLTSVEIPESVTSIGRGAFKGCSGLTSVEIPAGVTFIGSSAFYGCSRLTSVVIPSSVTSIGDHAFYGCSGLTCVTLGYTNYWYYTSSLENAANKTGGTVVPLSATDLAANARLVRSSIYVGYYWYKVD